MSGQSSNYSTYGNAEAATGPSASENTGAFQSVKTYLSNKDYKFYLCLSATAVLVGAGVYYFSSSPKSKKKKRPPKRRHQGTGVKKSEPRSGINCIPESVQSLHSIHIKRDSSIFIDLTSKK